MVIRFIEHGKCLFKVGGGFASRTDQDRDLRA